MSDYKRIRYEVQDRVAEVTMIREPVNAIDMLLAEEVVDAYTRVRHDPDVRAVILTSDCEAAFSAGMDLKMIRGKTGVDLRNFLEVLYFGMHDAQYRLAKPSIAAVTGAGPCGRRHLGRLLRYDRCRRRYRFVVSGNRCRGHSRHALRPFAAADWASQGF